MATTMKPALRCLRRPPQSAISICSFSTSATASNPSLETTTSTGRPPPPPLDPNFVSTPRLERKLLRETGKTPFFSRRRRALAAEAQITPSVAFEQLPYQCFQEARKVLAADRAVKLKQIDTERKRIAKVQAEDASVHGGENKKKIKLRRMNEYLEQLKIYADINDPLIKKRFEDGNGDMSRPVYRHLANKKWRSYARPLLMQRITQMHLIPDVLPYIDPIASVTLSFGRRHITPGDFVSSAVSVEPPFLQVQTFDKDPRLVTIAVIDADVPNLETDMFDYRCHFLASNIPISAVRTQVPLSRLDPATQIIQAWLPPVAQKGSPYHRLSVFILEQPSTTTPLDVTKAKQQAPRRDKFVLRSFSDKFGLKPIGAHLFRNQWDESTAAVMTRFGMEGAGVELKRKRPEKLDWKYKVKDGGRYR